MDDCLLPIGLMEWILRNTNSFCGCMNQYSSEYQIFGILELLLKQIGRLDRLSIVPSQTPRYDQKCIANCPAQF
jgi:hypothetical protein